MKKHDIIASHHSTRTFFKFAAWHGFIMPKRYRLLYVVYGCLITGLGTVYLPLGFTLSYFSVDLSQIEISALLTSLQVVINCWGGLIKLMIVFQQLKRLRATQPIMDKLDERCIDDDEVNELFALKKLGHQICIFFFSVYICYSTSTLCGSVALGRPPYSLYLPLIDWRKSNWEFIAASLIEYSLMDMACVQQTINDGYAVLYICILRTHMKILIMRISKLGIPDNKSTTPCQQTKELKRCITDHKNILDLFNLLAPLISITVFIQFAITAAMMGITLINLLVYGTKLFDRIATCSYICAVVVQIFPVCYFAQSLLDVSGQLSSEIFHANWMYQNYDYRRLLVIFMQRTQRPIEFFAAKLFPVSLSSFVSIAKFSFSLFTFIKQMGLGTN